MARKATSLQSMDPTVLLKPMFELKVCVTCGLPAEWKFDSKKRRPYHYCPHCGVRIFIYHLNGLIGLQVLHEMVLRTGPGRVRQAVRDRVERRLLQIERRPRPKKPRAAGAP